MHIGSMRTALFAYLYAKQNHGTFILRIEDTDKSREVTTATQHIIDSLHWLGIEWEYGPDKPGPFGSCVQSERLPIYRQYAEKLIAAGYAYPDPYSAEELQKFRADAEARNKPFLYRSVRPENITEAWDGQTPLRLKVPEIKRYQWQDAVRGTLQAGPEMLDDIILIKEDGFPTYNFAHIVDDHDMGVTHIMRGDEFISSTPKFLSIYDALGIDYPVFVTLPPIMRPDRTKKLGKRDGAKDILEYRNDGILPEAMMNFLALIGWNPGEDRELMTETELCHYFRLEKIQKGGGVFNEEKLLWMNKQYIQKLSTDDFFTYAVTALSGSLAAQVTDNPEPFRRLLPAIQERTHSYQDIQKAAAAGEYDFLYTTPAYDVELLRWKQDSDATDSLPRLEALHDLLTDADEFTSAETVKELVWSYAEETGKGQVLWPFRVSVTGRERSPDPFISAYALGKAETVTRLSTAINTLKASE